MRIEVRGDRPDDALESHRPKDADWHVVICGKWEQDTYHSGWAQYSVAKAGPGKWVMDCMEWNGDLDALTQEEVDAGDINADQEQQLWNMSLQEAQAVRYHRIVAVATELPANMAAEAIGKLLHKAVMKDGGFDIEEQY
jgi:hypothetical protein